MCVCVCLHYTICASLQLYVFVHIRSLQQARQVKLLDGYKIFMTSNVTPDRAALSDIIKCSGGQLLDVLPTTKDDQTLIISCDQDLHTCNSALDAGLVLYTPELILSGALRQELDLKTYPLTCVCVHV